jgi:hypothetical protein
MPYTGVVPSSAPSDAVKEQPAMQQVQAKVVTPPAVAPKTEPAEARLAASAKAAQEVKVPDESSSVNVGANPILPDHPSILSGSGDGSYDEAPRGLFASDRAFPGFIGPISNPVLSKDPRSLTEARFLFINNIIPPEHLLGGGNFQTYHLQLRVALSERLSFIAEKDGFAAVHPHIGGNADGWLNLAAGLKYLLIRDVQHQFLVSSGLMYEVPTGERRAFQGTGQGIATAFLTLGKEIGTKAHLLDTFGFQFPADREDNSSFFYNSLHLDYQLFECLYPLAEVNWFHYVAGGHHGLPPGLGEGDGLVNLGTSGVSGNDLVTFAVGLKAILGAHAELGAAWEFPLSNRKDLIDNRLFVEFIARY